MFKGSRRGWEGGGGGGGGSRTVYRNILESRGCLNLVKVFCALLQMPYNTMDF